MCMLMGYSTTTLINNKVTQTIIILQYTSMVAEYTAHVTYDVTVL